MRLVHSTTHLAPELAPHEARVPERLSVSLERRVTVTGAPPVPDKLRKAEFVPVDAALWVCLETVGDGRWSVYLWGPDQRTLECAQWTGTIRHGGIETSTPPPVWVLSTLNSMLAEVKENIARMLRD